MKTRGVGQKRRIAGYKAAWRIGRKIRRRATVNDQVAAKDTYMRRAVYYRQNGCERLTPAQRRRVQHKENAGRRG